MFVQAYNDNSYLFCSCPLTWPEARDCTSFGGDLVAFETRTNRPGSPPI